MDDEGWFHTGDMVHYDEEWYFYVVDRKKDMFISGGENVYPAEIEAVLYKHPAVHMCAVIGVPDAKWGEVGKACVVLKPGATATEEELLAHMQQHLARYKVPKSVECCWMRCPSPVRARSSSESCGSNSQNDRAHRQVG